MMNESKTPPPVPPSPQFTEGANCCPEYMIGFALVIYAIVIVFLR